jgi:hypothetical protein
LQKWAEKERKEEEGSAEEHSVRSEYGSGAGVAAPWSPNRERCFFSAQFKDRRFGKERFHENCTCFVFLKEPWLGMLCQRQSSTTLKARQSAELLCAACTDSGIAK